MNVNVGDHVIIEPNRINTTTREGEILEVMGSRLWVRWDDGHESVFVPGSDCRFTEAPDAPEKKAMRLSAHIDLRVTEDDRTCTAVATLMSSRGAFEASGSAHRHPRDPLVPRIGEELAIGRALASLSEQLLAEADVDVASGARTVEHLLT